MPSTMHDTYQDTEAVCICGQHVESQDHDQDGCYQEGATVIRMYATDLTHMFRAAWTDPDTDRRCSALINRSMAQGRWYVYPYDSTAGTFGFLGAAVQSLFPTHDPSGRQCAIWGQDPQAADACPGCIADARF